MGRATMDKPAVLLLTDDANIARAIEMLLSDWGFDGKAATSDWDEPRASGAKSIVAGILVDLNSARTALALEKALALRARVGASVPILIQANNSCSTEPLPPADKVTISPKPADPGCIRLWLVANGWV